ncbi:hypothetical protein MHZ93_21995 [Roseomonas sp. ACRSG]|nr:hypothetical protein [Roseomonas sp. ACRSG]
MTKIEAEMAKLQKENALLEKKLGDPTTYARFKPEDIAWATQRQGAIAKQVAALEEEWLELQEKLETA